MALDHYISQVHLRNFYSPLLGEAFYAIRKDDLKIFRQSSSAVCRIEENSTNAYLREDRIVEEFLKTIEPKYNNAVSKLQGSNISADCIYVLAGFVSYVLVCSPAGMRIQSQPLKASVEETAKLMDTKGSFPPPPHILEGKSITELLEKGKIQVKIDPKYPQAIGITRVLSITKVFGNSEWEILHNPHEDSPFFTSDFPVVIERAKDPRVLNRIVPLTPYLAIRICPNVELNQEAINFDFSNFHYRRRKLSRSEVAVINQGIVRCAESVVFFSSNQPWVQKFVARNANFRIEPKTHRVSHGKGTLILSTQEISPYTYANTR
ncbi:MAG: DUF4238 domain-containing protein [Nitrospiraceae bacterium]|nr:DUF4238 domain-containing protein [Nitrospiraceae bacterium]